jgi:hypothetical protein
VRRFVHCSSVGVYGRIDRPPADEETHCRARNIHYRSKLAGEQALGTAIGPGRYRSRGRDSPSNLGLWSSLWSNAQIVRHDSA